MNEQTVCGDAACHEVVIQMTEDIQLLCSNLFMHKEHSDLNHPVTIKYFDLIVTSSIYEFILCLFII